MKIMKTFSFYLAALVVALSLAGTSGCSKKNANGGGHGHHHHVGLMGGTLVELGDHQFNLEWVRDAEGGTLSAYVLDAHAENFVRVPLPAIALTVTVNGQNQPLVLTAVANAVTGETVGNTSQFSVKADWVKTAETFTGVIPELEIRGAKFTNVTFSFPKASGHGKH
jgi:hypothetical protein